MDTKLVLAVCSLFAAMAATATRAANELPAVTVTGNVQPAPPGDTVSRDWTERSPEMHWPTAMFNGAAEIFTHNQIEINASCTTVWDRLVQAERWPQWCPFSSKVQIWGGATVLQKTASLPGLVPTCRKISRPLKKLFTEGSILADPLQ
jgi:hypothetical protein